MKDLIERLEKATGPDDELNLRIKCALDGNNWEIWRFRYVVERLGALDYTGSIDAALTLVPEGAGWNLQGNTNVFYAMVAGHGNKPAAPTPAIALCIAALKARLHSPAENADQ